MGCLSERQKGTTTITCPQGWDDLASEFKIKSRMKIGTTRFNGKSMWYVRLGNPPEGFKFLSQIARKYKINPKSVMPPTRLGSRAINKFATTELVGILKRSSLFDKLLNSTYYDSDLLNKIGTNKRVIRDDYKSADSDDERTMEEESTQQNTETTTEKRLQWALKQGTIPDHKDYPVLHQFGIPIDNTQTTQLLLLELQKCQEQVQKSSSSWCHENFMKSKIAVCACPLRLHSYPPPHRNVGFSLFFTKRNLSYFCVGSC
jgi:hypothetical protein